MSAVQLSTLEAEQDYLAMRVRQELAACRVVAVHLAKLTSMLEQNPVPRAASILQAPRPLACTCSWPHGMSSSCAQSV